MKPIIQQLNHSYAARSTQIRHAIDEHRNWIEAQLAVQMSDAVILHVAFGIHNAAIKQLLGYEDSKAPLSASLARVAERLEHAATPDGFVPMDELTTHRVIEGLRESLSSSAEKSWVYSMTWIDGPVLLRLREVPVPVVSLTIGYRGGPDSSMESQQDLLIVPKRGLESVISMLKRLHASHGKARLKVGRGDGQLISNCTWDQLTLDQSITNLLKHDFELFFEREHWFRQMGLPFRRGYLLHGPPGCGKSSAIRAMTCSRGLTAYTMRFFNPHVDDGDLDDLFSRAAQNAPSMVILEDIDRVFPRVGHSKTQISLQALLNALDGVGTGEGIITVGTANEPTALDPAILKRPGRFDRVVLFPLPTPDLRREYFQKLPISLADPDLDLIADETDGMSFAQLREIHILAAQLAFVDGREIVAEDLLDAVWKLRQSSLFGTLKSESAGFVRRSPKG